MNTNYKFFDYGVDFNPSNYIFNTNIDYREVGINNFTPESNLDINGNVSVTDLQINKNIRYNNGVNYNNTDISLLYVGNNDRINFSKLISSEYEDGGIEWSVVNNNNVKLTLRNIEDNTRLEYLSPIFNVDNNLYNLPIVNQTVVTLKYIYIMKLNGDKLNPAEVNNIFNQLNVKIEYDGILSYINKFNEGLFKIMNYMTLSSNELHNIKIHNLNGYRIQLCGLYDYNSGSLWTYQNNNIFTIDKVGVNKPLPNDDFEVIGNTHITGNLTIANNINSGYLIADELNINNNLDVANIESIGNELIINKNLKKIGIGTSEIVEYIDIGEKFKVKDTGEILLNNLNINNNINFTQITKTTRFRNGNNEIYNSDKSALNIKNVGVDTAIFDNDKTNFLNRLHIVNNDLIKDDEFCVEGNLSIQGNLFIKDVRGELYYDPVEKNIKKFKTDNLTVEGIFRSDGYNHVNKSNIEELSIDVEDYKLPSQNNKEKPGVYYDYEEEEYRFFNGKYDYEIFSNMNLINLVGKKFTKLETYNSAKINLVNNNKLYADKLNINKKILLNSYNNLNSSSSIELNVNTMRLDFITETNNIANQKFFDISY